MIATGMKKESDNESESIEKKWKDSKPKHDWYQTENHVTVAVMHKNLREEEVSVSYGTDVLEVTIGEHRLQFKLHQTVVPDNSTYKFCRNKVEVRLAKLVGQRWPALEKMGEEEAPKSVNNKKKNWDRFVKENVEADDGPYAPFQQIYQQCDDDMRRAMMKSMQESGGTVLSTDWADVSSRVVKRHN